MVRTWMILGVAAFVAAGPASAAPSCETAGGDAAVAACSETIARGDLSAQARALAFFRRAGAYAARSDLDRALADYDDAIRLDPSFGAFHNARANLLRRKGDLDGAIAGYGDAARVDPKYATAYLNRGLAYVERGDLAKAVADYSAVVRIDPNNHQGWRRRANAWRGLGRLDQAIADGIVAIRLEPTFVSDYADRGTAYALKGDPAAARSDFEAALALDAKHAPALAGRAELRARAGDLDGALADAAAAAGARTRPAEIDAVRAYVLARQGAFAAADAAMDAALRADPANATALLLRADIRVLRGDRDGARADFSAVLARQPDAALARQGLAALQPPAAPARALRRVALVIGNGAYASVRGLPNPPRDAQAMAELFRAAGFDDVRLATDLGVAAMRGALRAFADVADQADIAVVFYAGHGVEIGGQNYLIPVDATLRSDLDVQDEAINLDRVLDLLAPVKRLKFIILDACRDNPFAPRMRMSTVARSVGRGLGLPSTQTSNTLIAYAAKAGSTASDGEGRNSPFTTALLRRLTTPGLDVRIALGEAHDDVLEATRQEQEPFLYGALGGGALTLGPQAR